MSVDLEITPLHNSFRSLRGISITDAGVTALCRAAAAHPAIKRVMYGCNRCLFLPAQFFTTPRLGANKGITDASCPALADLLRTVPTLEILK